MSPLTLTLTSPEVVSVRGMRGLDQEDHVDWYIDFAPEPEPAGRGRVVFGTIHAVHDDVGTDVMVASYVMYEVDAEPSSEEFEEALGESDVAEALWDIARIGFGAVGGMLGNRAELPRKAPNATIGTLSLADDPAGADGDD